MNFFFFFDWKTKKCFFRPSDKKSRQIKKTASYFIYTDEIFFYLCTFWSGRKLRLSVKRANNTNMTVNTDDVSDITIIDSLHKNIHSFSEQLNREIYEQRVILNI